MPKRRTCPETSSTVTLSCSAQSVGSLALTTWTASPSAALAVAAPTAACNPAATMSIAARRTASAPRRIDITGICGFGQRAQPRRNLVPRAPVLEDELLRFPDRRVESGVAERAAALEAGNRDVALDRGELERQPLRRLRDAGDRFRLEPLDVDLDEGRHSVPRDQRVERGHRHRDAVGPSFVAPPRRVARGPDEGLRRRAHGRIIEIEVQRQLALASPDRHGLDRDGAIAAVEQLQGFHERRLRFDGDDTRAEPTECADPVADVGTDVEHEIA